MIFKFVTEKSTHKAVQMKTEREKCAEVFRNGPGNFTFYCAYCTEQFEMHCDALNHIETHFSFDSIANNAQLKINSLEIEPEGSQTESDTFVRENQKTEIQPIANDGNITKILETSNDYFKQLGFDQIPNRSDNKNLNEVKLEPIYVEAIVEIEAEPIEKSSVHRKNYKKSSAEYAKFGYIGGNMMVECDKCHSRVQKHSFLRHFLLHNTNRKPKKKFNKYANFGYITRKKLVECDVCHNRLQKEYFLRHFQMHTNPKSFVCPICKKGFNIKNGLDRHMVRVHSDESKKYCCQYCSHRFHELSNLKQHIRIHTGEKPFKCDMCGKGFNQSSSAKNHMRIHTNEKPYKCELCDKEFGSQSSYRLHKRRHERAIKIKCSTCDKEFSSKQDFLRHNMIHTGERPFSCNVCSAAFKTRYTCNQHILTHTDKKPYKCRFCHLIFTLCHTRRIHERTVHNDIKRCGKLSEF